MIDGSWPSLGTPMDAYVRYAADRTGILSFGMTPLSASRLPSLPCHYDCRC